ncbi:MAG: FKBP-type peptidyl-prolyl cis-trans isomerase [Lewinellaceae bacterium]|nr:FKBP-type peptidyl-prolyl cis-trans isomerase [Lewinellaceae bacterium]
MRKLFILAVAAAATMFACGQNEGVQTEHGFRFVNHTNKEGNKPQPGETVLVQTYTYIGDSLMASTQKNFGGPREFTLFTPDRAPKRIPAIYDALLLMSEGDSGTVYEVIDTFLQKFIPPALKDNKEVRYEVVLVDIITAEEKAKALAEAQARITGIETQVKATAADYKAGKLESQLTKQESGLKVMILDKGSGAPIQQGENIKVDYYGVLKDGTMFDNSFERGQPLPFPAGVGQMIAGFDQGVMFLNHGGKAYFFIPPQIGYGDRAQGSIPPNSELIFYVEVL